MKQKITAENWEIQNERDMNIACTNFTKASISLGFRRGGTSLVGRSLLSNILIVL
jgi:hypothetical protein